MPYLVDSIQMDLKCNVKSSSMAMCNIVGQTYSWGDKGIVPSGLIIITVLPNHWSQLAIFMSTYNVPSMAKLWFIISGLWMSSGATSANLLHYHCRSCCCHDLFGRLFMHSTEISIIYCMVIRTFPFS